MVEVMPITPIVRNEKLRELRSWLNKRGADNKPCPLSIVAMAGGGKTLLARQLVDEAGAMSALCVHLNPYDVAQHGATGVENLMQALADRVPDMAMPIDRAVTATLAVALHRSLPEQPPQLVIFDGVDSLSREQEKWLYVVVIKLVEQYVQVLLTSRASLREYRTTDFTLNAPPKDENVCAFSNEEVRQLLEENVGDYATELASSVNSYIDKLPLAFNPIIEELKRFQLPKEYENMSLDALTKELEDGADLKELRDVLGAVRILWQPAFDLRSPAQWQHFNQLKRNLKQEGRLLSHIHPELPERLHPSLRKSSTSLEHAERHKKLAEEVYAKGYEREPQHRLHLLIEWLYHHARLFETRPGDNSETIFLDAFTSLLNKLPDIATEGDRKLSLQLWLLLVLDDELVSLLKHLRLYKKIKARIEAAKDKVEPPDDDRLLWVALPELWRRTNDYVQKQLCERVHIEDEHLATQLPNILRLLFEQQHLFIENVDPRPAVTIDRIYPAQGIAAQAHPARVFTASMFRALVQSRHDLSDGQVGTVFGALKQAGIVEQVFQEGESLDSLQFDRAATPARELSVPWFAITSALRVIDGLRHQRLHSQLLLSQQVGSV